MTAPCPICRQPGGFHLSAIHDQHEVPRELLLEPGWVKEAHEKLKAERAAKEHAARVAAIAEQIVDEHAEILERLAAEPIEPGDIVIDPDWLPESA